MCLIKAVVCVSECVQSVYYVKYKKERNSKREHLYCDQRLSSINLVALSWPVKYLVFDPEPKKGTSSIFFLHLLLYVIQSSLVLEHERIFSGQE